jgi:hypothetical protein
VSERTVLKWMNRKSMFEVKMMDGRKKEERKETL